MKHVSHLLDDYLDRLRNQPIPSEDERQAWESIYGEREQVEVLPRETWDPEPRELNIACDYCVAFQFRDWTTVSLMQDAGEDCTCSPTREEA